MSEKLKHLEEIESCYEIEYFLRQGIHSRDGELLRLEHQNAKLYREIEGFESRIKNLESEFAIRDIPRMKESLKSSARLAIKQEEEIERLNARISTILETTSDISKDTVSGDKIDHITECKDLFEYLKALLIELSRKEGNAPINPGDIDLKYIEATSRYCFPVLFDKYAILDQDDTTKIKIQFAEYILRMFGLENMYEYENLHTRGEIELEFIDRRNDGKYGLHNDFGALYVTGIEWDDLGLCDLRCWYEWMSPESYQDEVSKKYFQPSVHNALNIRAVEIWDSKRVNRLCIEESAEVIQAITHLSRGKCDVEKLFGEMADLQIMLDQMKILYGQFRFDEILAEKYSALDEKLDSIESGEAIL